MSINSKVVSKLIAITLIALTIGGCGSKEKQSPPSVEQGKAEKQNEHPNEKGEGIHLTPEEKMRAGIVTAAAEKREVQDQLILTANIAANQERLAHVTPRVEGKLSKVMANLGDMVNAGSPLAEIDSIQMGEARAQYRSSQSELALAHANFDRINRLYEEEVVPQKQWLESKSLFERANSAAKADSERLRMYGGLNKQDGSTYIVTAPFKGLVIEKTVVMGELAKTSDVIFTIADVSTVWIEADIAEKDLGKLSVGQAASVTVTAYPDEVFKGKVSYISNTLEKATRTVKARIELPNPESKLRIDMFAKASIELPGSKEIFVVPSEAVVILQGINTVYVENGDSFEARPIDIGERLNNAVEVKSGINFGDQVVISGVYALKARQLKSQISDEH